ncbi:MAG: hypothetical protein NZ533_09595 [Casimicrobiaceae bacterium]|nr:hypothetical protein [Casimicrobiaceae bacterium]
MWWMARHDEYWSLWPLGYPLSLRVFREFLGDVAAPTALFFGQLLLLASAVALLCGLVFRPEPVRAVLWTALFLGCPVIWALVGHLWSDVLLLGVLLLMTALLVWTGNEYGAPQRLRVPVVLSVLTLLGAYAASLRYNAIVALLPLAWFTFRELASTRLNPQAQTAPAAEAVSTLGREPPSRAAGSTLRSRLRGLSEAIRRRSRAFGVVMIALIWAFTPWSLNHLARYRSDTLAFTLIWDVQAVSVAVGRSLLEDGRYARLAPLEVLRAGYNPAHAVPLYEQRPLDLPNAATGLTWTERRALLRIWREAISEQPLAYLAHRARLAWLLLRSKTHPSHGGAYEFVQTQFRDNPARHRAWQGAQHLYQRTVAAWQNAHALSGGLWLALFGSAALVGLARRKRRLSTDSRRCVGVSGPLDRLAWVLLASAALYLLGLFLTAPAADLRYLLWPIGAVWAAAALAWRPVLPTCLGNDEETVNRQSRFAAQKAS